MCGALGSVYSTATIPGTEPLPSLALNPNNNRKEADRGTQIQRWNSPDSFCLCFYLGNILTLGKHATFSCKARPRLTLDGNC